MSIKLVNLKVKWGRHVWNTKFSLDPKQLFCFLYESRFSFWEPLEFKMRRFVKLFGKFSPLCAVRLQTSGASKNRDSSRFFLHLSYLLLWYYLMLVPWGLMIFLTIFLTISYDDFFSQFLWLSLHFSFLTTQISRRGAKDPSASL